MTILAEQQSWSASVHALDHQYDAWVDQLNETFGLWNVHRNRQSGFQADVTSTRIGSLQVVECICDPCGAERSESVARRDTEERLAIQLVLSGREHMRLGDQDGVLEEGDIFVWDSTQPMMFEVKERLHKISALVPLQRLKDWKPNTWRTMPRHVKAGTASSQLLGGYLKSLSRTNMSAGPVSDTSLIEAAIALLAAPDISGTEHPSLKRSQFEHVCARIRQQLQDPSLTLDKIAVQNGISLRYLHWLFQENGDTAWRFIVGERLKSCLQDLVNPAMRHRSVTEIAFSWGFSDAAYFSRKFKQHYGESPSTLRRMRRDA